MVEKRGRPKSKKPGKKVEPTLPADAYQRIVQLSKMGGYPGTPTEVAKYLIMRELDDLNRAGVFRETEK